VNELHLFAGAGGGVLAGQMLGHRCVCAVEWEPYAAAVLAQRQNDGLLPPFPIWDDVQTFDGKPWRGIVDIVAGGFPCQDISVAGKGAGITGARSGMWGHMARIVGEVRPRFVFVENSPALITRGLGVVLSDLAALGYDCRWTVLGAADVGAPHQRDRFWLLAHAEHSGLSERRGIGNSCSDADNLCRVSGNEFACGGIKAGSLLADTNSAQRQGGSARLGIREEHADIGRASWWESEPEVGRVAHGVAARVDRLKAIGNGQVPLCAATAFRMLAAEFGG